MYSLYRNTYDTISNINNKNSKNNRINHNNAQLGNDSSNYLVFPFEIQIPNNANVSLSEDTQSTIGSYAKTGVPWSSDIFARSIAEIEVVFKIYIYNQSFFQTNNYM